jgi:molecular chaperone GrpE
MAATEDDNGAITDTELPEIERLKEDVRREHEMYLRALADFDNYRRRVERERGNAVSSGTREIILSLLDLLDSFELALQHAGSATPSLSEGLKTIHRKLLNLLERQGITPIQSLGQAFDPRFHEAIDSVRSDDHESGIVVEEVQKGYRWGDELLRPARVRVAF